MSSEKDRIFLIALEYCLDQKIMTRKELCEATGLYSGRLSQIINKKYSTGNKVQEKIAKAFGYEIDKFLSLGRELIEKTSNSSSAVNSSGDVTALLWQIADLSRRLAQKDDKIEKLEAQLQQAQLQSQMNEQQMGPRPDAVAQTVASGVHGRS